MKFIKDIIRYNSLRSLADVTIDFSGEDYVAAGVTLYPAGSKNFPPIEGSPSRIFIKTDLLQSALPFLKQLDHSFHLLTGSSDMPACPTPDLPLWLKRNIKLLTWVGTNLVEYEPWMLCVPIGLEERGRSNREPEQLAIQSTGTEERCIDIYLPYLSPTHPSRSNLLQAMVRSQNPRVIIEKSKLPFDVYLKRLRQSRFTICPRGNGQDTVRCYEAALSGSVPIVQRTDIWRLHRDLGFQIFETPDEIFSKTNIYLPKLLDSNALTMSYQADRIFNHQIRNFVNV